MDLLKKMLLFPAAMALTLGWLWYDHRPVAPPEATMSQVRDEAARGGYRLMETEELAKICAQPPPGFLLVDTRQTWEFRCGYIPGAVNFPMEPTWWSRWRARGPIRNLLGPDKNRLVVFY